MWKKKSAQGFYLTSYIQWDVHELKFPCNTLGQGNDFFGGKYSPFCYKYFGRGRYHHKFLVFLKNILGKRTIFNFENPQKSSQLPTIPWKGDYDFLLS